LKLYDRLLVFFQPLSELAASNSLFPFNLAQSLDQKHQWLSILPTFLQNGQFLFKLRVVELIVRLIELGRIGESSSIEAG
jgi:hypothetical protein